MTPDKREAGDPDFITRCSERLADGWKKYVDGFGEAPHGTRKQMAALLVFAHLDEDPQIVSDHDKAAMFDAMAEHGWTLMRPENSGEWRCLNTMTPSQGFGKIGSGPTPVDAVKDALARLK